MATYNKHEAWVDYLCETANCATDQFVVALTAAANAPVASNSNLADLTQISYTNLSSRNVTTSSASQTSGTYTLVLSDLTLTASGNVATFRYVDIYDDTVTSPTADPLVCFFDYASDVSLATSETFTVNFGASLFSLT